MKFSVFQLSRRGGRALNEDRMGYCYTRESALFVLADGMGGHPDGEIAAQIACIDAVHEIRGTGVPDVGARQAVVAGHARAHRRHRAIVQANGHQLRGTAAAIGTVTDEDAPVAVGHLRDVQAAVAAGCPPHLVLTGQGARHRGQMLPPDYPPDTVVHEDLAAFAEFILAQEARGQIAIAV